MKREGLSIDLGMVIILLILVNVPLWALAFLTVDQVQSSLQTKVADDFRAIAKKNAVTINYAINHLVAEVATIAISPVIRDVVRAACLVFGGRRAEPKARGGNRQALVDPASEALRRPGVVQCSVSIPAAVCRGTDEPKACHHHRPHGRCGSGKSQDCRL